VDLRSLVPAARTLTAASLLFTLGCATAGHDAQAHGRGWGHHHDHHHATEGAVVGGLAGAGIGRVIAGRHDAAAGFFLGGALGAITGAIVGDAMDRAEQRDAYAPPPPRRAPWPDGPPPPPRRHERDRDRDWDDDDRWHDDADYGDPYGYEPSEDDDSYAWEPPGPDPLPLSLPDEVLFDAGSARLTPGAERRLRAVATALRRHTGARAVVRGHASPAERREDALSEARAQAVREYLLGEGIAPSRVTALGLGARFPLASEASAEGRQRNRRAEIEVHGRQGSQHAGLW